MLQPHAEWKDKVILSGYHGKRPAQLLDLFFHVEGVITLTGAGEAAASPPVWRLPGSFGFYSQYRYSPGL